MVFTLYKRDYPACWSLFEKHFLAKIDYFEQLLPEVDYHRLVELVVDNHLYQPVDTLHYIDMFLGHNQFDPLVDRGHRVVDHSPEERK
jgi:hypothetical protein